MGSGIKNAKKKADTGPRTMIIETHYCNRQEMLAMTHDRFTVDGVEFWITGTTIDDFGVATCSVKNLSNGKSSDIEHQKLCRIIKTELEKLAAETAKAVPGQKPQQRKEQNEPTFNF